MKILNLCQFNDSFKNKEGEEIAYSLFCLIVKNSPNSPAYTIFAPARAFDKKPSDYVGKNINILYTYNEFQHKYKISKIELINNLIDLDSK